jgi:hypothetical protein
MPSNQPNEYRREYKIHRIPDDCLEMINPLSLSDTVDLPLEDV